jgi:cytochrome c oxidase subunit IV
LSVHAPAHHPTEASHPGASKYIQIAVILTVITAVEVAVYYVLEGPLRPLLAPVLIVLSAVKFAIVVMFYMHLKFDHRLFTGMFLFGLATATFTIIAFIALFQGLVPVPGPASVAPPH